MKRVELIKEDLKKYADPEKAKFLPAFFKAYPGGYGEDYESP